MPQQNVSSNRGDDQLIRRLQQLTGCDQVLLNDRDYMNRLHDRLEEEYSKQQSHREKKLREEEIRRIRRLKREGVIDDAQYQSEMTHIQSHGVGSDRYGNASGNESQLSLNFPLLTDGCLEFYDNPDATTYRGFVEQRNEMQRREAAKQNAIEVEERHEETVQEPSSDNTENENVMENNEENVATHEEGEEEEVIKTSSNEAAVTTPRYSRPQSVSIQKLKNVDTVADMYEVAKSMVFIEVGLNPPKRKGGK
jgi:hypothetical protein